MRNKSTMKHTVFVYLLLHTAIIVMLVFLLLRIGILPGNPFLVVVVIAGSAAFVLYTAHTIVRCMNDEIADREKWLAQISADMQAMLTTMREYETELERRSAIIRECGKGIEQRADVITAYSNRINELVAAAKSINDNDQASDNGSERKTG